MVPWVSRKFDLYHRKLHSRLTILMLMKILLETLLLSYWLFIELELQVLNSLVKDVIIGYLYLCTTCIDTYVLLSRPIESRIKYHLDNEF